MLGKQFPSRGRTRQQFARNEGVERSFSGLGRTLALPLCIALNACGGPSWPGGIHAVLAASPRGLRVVQVPADSPARRAGLEEGDAIVRIDGKPVAGLSSQRIHELLSGEVGSPVELIVLRDGTEQALRIERAPYGSK